MDKKLIQYGTECRGGMAIYWIGSIDDPKQFAVAFEGERMNIARQGIAESVVLALGMLSDDLDRLDGVK